MRAEGAPPTVPGIKNSRNKSAHCQCLNVRRNPPPAGPCLSNARRWLSAVGCRASCIKGTAPVGWIRNRARLVPASAVAAFTWLPLVGSSGVHAAVRATETLAGGGVYVYKHVLWGQFHRYQQRTYFWLVL